MKEKNVSNLTKTLAVVSLLAPVTAQPLGIGDIQLHSALNQKLNAEIKLHLAGENPADISVRLAPPEKFDQAGVAWNYVLSKLKFEPVTQANGSVVVKITSKEALTEPFLDFLLEVSWPQGSLFREFTLLLDPPADYQPPAVPTATAAGGYDFDAALAAYERPSRKTRSGRRSAKAESNITPNTPSSGEYGPTQTQDTLWGIADRLGNERNVPTKKMLDALFHANPMAFNHGDMNSLKTGAVLKIPETEAILQGSASQRSTPKPERKEATAASKPTAALGAKALELVAPTDAKIAENTEVGSQAKSGAGTKGATAAASGEAASGSVDAELQARIEKLEQQLNMMQQLLALKDQQLATLQNKDKPAPQQGATATTAAPKTEQPLPPATATPPSAPQTTAPTPAAQAPATPAAPAQPPAAAKPKPAKAPKPAPQPPKEEASQPYIWTVGGLSTGILGILGWLWWRKRKIEEQTNTESMFASASQIKMPDADSTLSVPVMEMSSAGSYDVGTVGESSFISDFTPSDFDAFDTDQNEVDPMSEADVYLAYGRYQQAEELIRNAIKDQPDRDEYKLKLLEILYANESKESFTTYAQELADAGKQTDRPFWSKVVDMGKEIAPESILFGGTATTIESSASEESNTSTSVANFDVLDEDDASRNQAAKFNDDLIDLDAPTLPDMALMDDINSELAELQLTSGESLKSDDNSLDFDLSSFSESSADQKEEGSAQPANIESIDFDISGLSLDTPPAVDDKSSVEQKAKSNLESFDFNFDIATPDFSDQPKSEADKASNTQPLDLASLESFEFPDFEADSEVTKSAANHAESEKIADASASNLSDEFDFNFDFEVPTGESETKKGEIDLGVADLTDMDEYETKIDLAKAYIDMGDSETAKTIAEEILEKGNKDQKLAAQAILDELK